MRVFAGDASFDAPRAPLRPSGPPPPEGRAIAYDQKRLSSRTSAQREDPGPGRERMRLRRSRICASLVRDDSSFAENPYAIALPQRGRILAGARSTRCSPSGGAVAKRLRGPFTGTIHRPRAFATRGVRRRGAAGPGPETVGLVFVFRLDLTAPRNRFS